MSKILKKADFRDLVFNLLKDEPFYAALSRHITKKPTKSIPTAGVYIDPKLGTFKMIYNPDFVSKLTFSECKILLRHEFLHIILGHLSGRIPYEDKDDRVKRKVWNIATDCAINCQLMKNPPEPEYKNLFDLGVHPSKYEYPDYQHAEYYYRRLMADGKGKEIEEMNKAAKEALDKIMGGICPMCGKGGDEDGGGCGGNEDGGKGGDEDGGGCGGDEGEGDPCPGCSGSGDGVGMDSHDGWSDISSDVMAEAEENLRRAIKESAQEANASSRGWGSVSQDTQKMIEDYLKSSVNWQAQLRYFVKTSQRSSRVNSQRRINRRFPYIHAGRKVRRTARLAVAVDQSGSVSDAMLSKFFREMNSLAKECEFTVVPFDTSVQEENVFVWEKNKSKPPSRVMCGGTCFDAPVTWANDKGFDGLIIMTDMEAPEPIDSTTRRLWVTSEGQLDHCPFTVKDKIIEVPLDDK